VVAASGSVVEVVEVVVASVVGVAVGCFSGALGEGPDPDEEEDEDEDPCPLEESVVSGVLVDVGADAVVDAEVDDDDEPESPSPSALRTPSINP
jgi:hypothetical protein